MPYVINQEWAEPLTHQDQMVLAIGLLISDNLSLPWQDGVAFFKTASGAGTVVQASFCEDLLMAPQRDFVTVGLGLVFAETIKLIDTIFYVKAQRTAGGNSGSVAFIGDDAEFPIKDALVSVLSLGLAFTDNLNYWLDQQSPPIVAEWDLIIGCPHLNNWLDQQVDFIVTPTQISKTDLITLTDAFSFSIGIPISAADTLTLSDFLRIGYGDSLAETLSLSDSIAIGYGNLTTDALILSDVLAIGYGDLLTDSQTLTDALAFSLGSSALTEVLSDSLTLSDSLAIGYGDAVTDQLSLTDALRIGYGDAVADQITIVDQSPTITGEYDIVVVSFLNNWSDVATSQLGLAQALSDSLTLSDSLLIGYGFAIAETLTLSDQLRIGYGDLITDTMTLADFANVFLNQPNIQESLSDTLTMADGLAIGYGDLISDQLSLSEQLGLGYGSAVSDTQTLTDAAIEVLGINEVLSDTVALSDSKLIGYGLAVPDSLTLSDSILSGIGFQITDSLLLTDFLALGYGDLISDSLSMSDAMASFVGGANLQLTPAETLTMSDQLRLGYGDIFKETMTLVDVAPTVVGEYHLVITSLPLVLADAATLLLNTPGLAETLTDQMSMSDALRIGYGSRVSDQIVLQDVAPTITRELNLLIGCPHLNNWLDGIKTTYGLVINESITLSDALKNDFPPTGQLSDALTMADQLFGIGYGNALADVLSLSDQLGFAIGGSEIAEFLSDTLTLVEQVAIFVTQPVFADQLVLLDDLLFDLANATIIQESLIDSLTLLDRLRVGYGNLVADSLTLTDAFSKFLLISNLPEILTDVLLELDQIGIGYGLQVAEQITQNVPLATDPFTRPNESPLDSAKWTTISGYNALRILSNKCVVSATGVSGSAENYTGITSPADQFVEVTLGSSALGGEFDIALRSDATRTNFYNFGFKDNGNGTADVYIKVFTPTSILLFENAALPFAPGDKFLAVAIGSSLLYFRNGSSIGSVIDNTFASGLVGLYLQANTLVTDIQISSFVTGLAVALRDQLTIGYGLLPIELQVKEIQLDVDTFTRANETPLNPAKWLVISPKTALQILSNKCSATTTGGVGSGQNFIGIPWSNDQAASVIIAGSAVGGNLDIFLRSGIDLGSNTSFGYDFGLIDNGDGTGDAFIAIALIGGGSQLLWRNARLPFSIGDELLALVIGRTLAFYKNGKLIGWANDLTFISGSVGLYLFAPNAVTDMQVTNFVAMLPTSVLSDQTIIGVGNLVADAVSMSDTDFVGYGNLITDSLTLADATATSFPSFSMSLIDSLGVLDTLAFGYGFLIAEQLPLTDSLAALFPLSGIFADQITITDVQRLGYGDLISDQLTLSDAFSIFRNSALISDQLTLSDSISLQQLGSTISIFPSDQLTLSDINLVVLGLGFIIQTDQILLGESTIVGYGDLVSDQFSLSDLMAFSFVLPEVLVDTLTLSDSIALRPALLPSDTLTLVDVLAFGYGNLFIDQLLITESPVLGFGLSLKDQIAQADQIGAGYGNITNDQMAAQTDQMAFVEGMIVLIADATPTQLDALSTLFTYALRVNDVVTFQEQLTLLWGIIVGESLSLADNVDTSLQNLISLALADDESAAWLENVLVLFVFAPTEIILNSLTVLPEVVAGLQIIAEASASSITVEPEVEEIQKPKGLWIPSEQGAFVFNPVLNSVYGKTLPPPGFQGEVASMLAVPLNPNHFSECTIAAWNPGLSTANFSIGPAVRMIFDKDGLISCYALELRYDGVLQMIWEVRITPGQFFGAPTDIVRNNLVPPIDYHPVLGDKLRIEAFENKITGKVNGIIVFGPVIDERITTGRPGIEGYPENSFFSQATQISNFRTGTLPIGEVQEISFVGVGDMVEV